MKSKLWRRLLATPRSRAAEDAYEYAGRDALGVAALCFAMLLAVTTLDRGNPHVGSAANELARALPLATAANLFYVWARRARFRVVARLCSIGGGITSVLGLISTLVAIYSLFRYLNEDAAIVYSKTGTSLFAALVLIVGLDVALYIRWTERRQKQLRARQRDTN